MNIKEVLAAGIVRDLRFCCKDAVDLYTYRLDHNCVLYKIIQRCDQADGSVLIRIVHQYNNSPLIHLFEEDDHV